MANLSELVKKADTALRKVGRLKEELAAAELELDTASETLTKFFHAGDTSERSARKVSVRDGVPTVEAKTPATGDRSRRLTHDELIRMYDAFRRGETNYRIAKQFGVTKHSVSYRRKKWQQDVDDVQEYQRGLGATEH